MANPHFSFPLVSFNHDVDECPDGEKFGLHMHDDMEILCVVTGKVGYVVEGRVYDLRPGSVMLMRSAETHKLLVTKSERYERYVINFRPEILEKYHLPSQLLAPFTERALGEKNHYLAGIFDSVKPLDLCREIEKSLEFLPPEDAIGTFLPSMLSLICSAFEKNIKHKENPKDDIAFRLIDHVNSHLFESLSLSSIAQSVHISESHLNRVFRAATGTSVYRYILSKRLIAAQQLIAQGETAQSAGQKCGFRDYSAFYRLYKKRFGASPVATKPK